MDSADFARRLTAAVPELRGVVDEHLREQRGRVLLHGLVTKVRRLSRTMFDRGESEALGRLLQVMDEGLRDGDDTVRRVISMAFVQDYGPEIAQNPSLVEAWPGALRAEAERQQPWRPHSRERQLLATIVRLLVVLGAFVMFAVIVSTWLLDWLPEWVVQFVAIAAGLAGLQWAVHGTRLDLLTRYTRKMRP